MTWLAVLMVRTEEVAVHHVRLIHWKASEAEERADQLRSGGYKVECEALSPAELRALRENPPRAVVIDLSRAPSQGRDLGLNLRKYKSTRHVPLVFVGGDPAKVARIKELLPDAAYTTWDEIGISLEQAIAHPPADPVVPESVFAAYAGTPLPKKLGIKANSVVALVGAPEGFEETLGELPERVVVPRSTDERPDVTLCDPVVRHIPGGGGAAHRGDGRLRRQGRPLDRLAEEVLWDTQRSVASRRARGQPGSGSGGLQGVRR